MHVVIAQIERKTINKVSAEAYCSHAVPSLGLSLVFAQKEAEMDIKLWIYASVFVTLLLTGVSVVWAVLP